MRQNPFRKEVNPLRSILFGFLFSLIFGSFSSLFALEDTIGKVFQAEQEKQGEILWKKAEDSFVDRKYERCVQELKLFLTLTFRHPKEMEARKLLSQSYLKLRDTRSLAKNELQIYKDFPHTEAGLSSYLESAKALVKMGMEEEAQAIFLDITKNHYSSRIVQEAELEMKQLQILKEIEK